MLQRVLFYYFIFINLAAFVLYGIDKLRSTKTGKSRISEKTLHTYALMGGFLGATLAMALFRHKVSKNSFLIKHIVILLLWIAAIVYYFTQVDTINFMR
jgi:uncharacterized membrane protein YsdA (DUF1294 family)